MIEPKGKNEKEKLNSNKLIIISVLLSLVLLTGSYLWNNYNVENLNEKYQKEFNLSTDYNEKFAIYEETNKIDYKFLFENNKSRVNNSKKNMEHFFKEFYNNNITANALYTDKSEYNEEELASIKSAYENLLNLKLLIQENIYLNKQENNKLISEIDEQLEKYSNIL